MQGSVNPDEFVVFKPTLKSGYRPLLRRTRGTKELKLVLDPGGSKMVKTVPVPEGDRLRFALGDDDVLTLARWGCQIEEHYSRKHGRFCPMDIEWAKDGQSGEIYIVQARPETVQALKDRDVLETYHLQKRSEVLVTGQSVGDKIGHGPVHVIADVHDLGAFKRGEVLVTDKTDPDWEPVMKKAAAIVTNRGGRTCHAAIVSRELGLPAVVGTQQRHRRAQRRSAGDGVLRRGGNGLCLRWEARLCCRQADVERHFAAADQDHAQRRQPGRGVFALDVAQRRRGSGAD